MSKEKSLEEKLTELEKNVTKLKEEKIRTEEKLKNLRKQKDEIIAELNILGVAPKDLSSEINKLDTEINTKLTDINLQIPEDTAGITNA